MTNRLPTRRLHLIANKKSGKGRAGQLIELTESLCREHGTEFIHYDIQNSADFDHQSQRAVKAATGKKDEVVVAAGGDGTIRGVASFAAGEDVVFAAVPCGTFNFFARTHRVPEELEPAVRLALTGEVRPVRLGEMNGHIFLINASLGLYAKSIREREKQTSRWGRSRFVAIFATLYTFLRPHRLLKVDLVQNGQRRHFRTPMIFIGNNALQLRDLAFDVASCMKDDLLAVVMMKPLTKMGFLRVILRGLTKTIEKEESVDSFCAESLTIYTHKKLQMVALDGELFAMTSPLKIQALPKVLNMVLPPRETPNT